MPIFRSNPKIEKNQFQNGRILWVPAIQNGYMAAPALTMEVDYDAFEKTDEERIQVKNMKWINRSEIREALKGLHIHPSRRARILNIDKRSIGKSIRATF